MKADPKTQLHVVDTVGPVRRAGPAHIFHRSFKSVLGFFFSFIWVLLAELIKQFLKYKNGSGRTEDDEGLPTKNAEHGSCQSSAEEALHHTLGNEKGTGSGLELILFDSSSGRAVSVVLETW